MRDCDLSTLRYSRIEYHSVTTGGSGEQIAKCVDALPPRFWQVTELFAIFRNVARVILIKTPDKEG